jgi:dCMP deaminase
MLRRLFVVVTLLLVARRIESGFVMSGAPVRRTSAGSAITPPSQTSPSGRQKRTVAVAAADASMSEPGGFAAAAAATSSTTRREDYLSWEDYFMAVSYLSAMRSKDPSTQVGACIVNAENRIVGIGYNGFPVGCGDEELPWGRDDPDPLKTKYMYVVHAEVNAILNRNVADTRGCRMYVGLFPCNECAKLIIQSGIAEVVYMSDKYHDRPPFVASRRLLDCAGVAYRQLVPGASTISLDMHLGVGTTTGGPAGGPGGAAAAAAAAPVPSAVAVAAAAAARDARIAALEDELSRLRLERG